MSEIRFYFDEHIANAVAQGLRRRKIDVVTAVEAGNVGMSDKKHLAFALEQGLVLVTHDADFIRLHGQGVHHAGIVFSKQGLHAVGEMIAFLELIQGVMTPDEMNDHLEFI